MISPELAAEIERDCRSEYVLLGGATPVRVLYHKADGLKAGAIAPDPETGALALRHDLLSRLAVSPEVEPIDAAEFDRRCAALHKR